MKKILRRAIVIGRVGVSYPTIWRMEKAGLFPRRIQISPGAIGWLEEDIDAWIESREVASGNEAAR